MKKHSIIWLMVLSTGVLVSCGGSSTSSVVSSSSKSSSQVSSSAVSSSSSVLSSNASSSSSSIAATLTAKVVDRYAFLPASKDTMTLYFKEGAPDFPYIKLDSDSFSLIGLFLGYSAESFTVTSADQKVIITTPKKNYATVDFVNKKITYDDFDSFYITPAAWTPLDSIAETGFNSKKEAQYIERESGSFYLRGEKQATQLDLGAYDIPMIYEDGAGYLPFATFADVFINPTNGGLNYNGQSVFIFSNFSDLKDLFYTPTPTGKVSEALAKYNYNELCFNFDTFYGLFDKRGLTSFDDYFDRLGFKEDMLSTDTLKSETAQVKAIFKGFSESHSGIVHGSAYTGSTFQPLSKEYYGPSLAKHFEEQKAFYAARTAGLGASYLPYQEVNDTAFITFDQFLTNGVTDYYTTPATKETAGNNTYALVEYAHSQITRDSSPITKVVVDLSNNGGGAVDAAVYLASWMTGDAEISIQDHLTGAKGTNIYKADINMDRVFDDKDNLLDKKVYCLTSPCSFSCGNLVPFLCKAAGNVTLLGQTTGGGACEVSKLNTALGATGQFSGRDVICTLKNGIYSDVDDGVEPHVWLNDKASYYNRSELAKYLDTLK